MHEPTRLRVEIAEAGGTLVEAPHQLADALGAHDIDARVVPLEAMVASRADAIVLHGGVPGALAAVRALRDDGVQPGTPVLMLGTPEGTGPFHEGPGFGAEHVLAIDASPARIAEVLHGITHRAPRTDPSRERRIELTMELAQRGEHGPSEWRTQSGDRDLHELDAEPPGIVRRAAGGGADDGDASRQVSEILPTPSENSAIVDHAEAAKRRSGSSPGALETPRAERRDSVRPDSHPGSSPGTGAGHASSTGTGSVPSTSQLFVVASISDELRKVLYDADRRVFPDRPPLDVSIPRGEDSVRELVPDEFVDALSLAQPEPERPEAELTFVGAREDVGAPKRSPSAAHHDEGGLRGHTPTPRATPAGDDEPKRPATSPGTPTSMSRRPPEPSEAGTRSSADAAIPALRPYPGEAPLRDDSPREEAVRPSVPPPRVALASSERGELAPLGAIALVGQLATGRLDVTLTLRLEAGPVALTLSRGELTRAQGEGWIELKRRALHRALSASVGAARATEASRAEPTFALERASRLADDAALAEVLVSARGEFTLEPRPSDTASPRLTQRPLLASLLELARRSATADRVIAHLLEGPSDPSASRFEQLSRLAVARTAHLERVLDLTEAPRELAWLLRQSTATSPSTLASLVAAAPDEPGLVGIVFAIAELGGLEITVLAEGSSLADTDLDARAERAIASLRERADRADYFEVLGIPRDADGPSVVDAHVRLRAELLAWPLADLGLARLEADRVRILSALDDAADVLIDPRRRRRYARGLSA